MYTQVKSFIPEHIVLYKWVPLGTVFSPGIFQSSGRDAAPVPLGHTKTLGLEAQQLDTPCARGPSLYITFDLCHLLSCVQWLGSWSGISKNNPESVVFGCAVQHRCVNHRIGRTKWQILRQKTKHICILTIYLTVFLKFQCNAQSGHQGAKV